MSALTDRLIDAQERALHGADLGYLREIADASTAAFVKIGLLSPLAQHRRVAPLRAWHLARLAATMAQDCGPCVQIVVDQARDAGVPREALQTVVDGTLDRLGPEDALAVHYGHAVATQSPDAEALARTVRDVFGAEARVEMALGVATAQVFPMLKRGLGRTLTCALAPPSVR
jgi:hypothetical protein